MQTAADCESEASSANDSSSNDINGKEAVVVDKKDNGSGEVTEAVRQSDEVRDAAEPEAKTNGLLQQNHHLQVLVGCTQSLDSKSAQNKGLFQQK
jgi:hypothetical protein